MLKGKTALITGASKGIGFAIAENFAANGADLLLLSRNLERLNANKIFLEEKYKNNVQVFCVDVADINQVKAVFSEVSKLKLKIDCIVNNAGIMLDAALMMMKAEVLKQNIEVNLFGTIHVSQASIKALIKSRQGSIINLTSIVGTNGSSGQSAYSASKSGVIGFTKSLSKELAPLNIRVNAIAPGFISTDLTANLSKQAKEKTLNNIGMRRFGSPEDVAKVALFLASNLSEYVTGQIIGVDGGMII